MNKRVGIAFFLLLLLLAVLLFWHSAKLKQAEPISNDTTLSNQTASPLNVPATNISPLMQSNAPLTREAVARLSREEKLKFAELQNNVPIDFWGKVIDESGSPLQGVTISADTRTVVMGVQNMAATTFPKISVTSGGDGLFEIRNKTGDVLSIKSLEKDGYEEEPDAVRGYNYTRGFIADRNNPIVFRLWPVGIHEQLITGSKHLKIIPDGRPYAIDFKNSTITQAQGSEGDVQVWIKYPQEITATQTNNWLSGITVNNGGIVEEPDGGAAMYIAPTTGYSATFRYDQQIRTGQRGSTGTKRFYVTLQNGQEFGRFAIDLKAPYNNQVPGFVSIDYAINPSGSRILR
jgi:hypothetical protein